MPRVRHFERLDHVFSWSIYLEHPDRVAHLFSRYHFPDLSLPTRVGANYGGENGLSFDYPFVLIAIAASRSEIEINVHCPHNVTVGGPWFGGESKYTGLVQPMTLPAKTNLTATARGMPGIVGATRIWMRGYFNIDT